MGKMPTNSLGKSSELKLHCFCLIDAYSMPKDICSVGLKFFKLLQSKMDSEQLSRKKKHTYLASNSIFLPSYSNMLGC